MVAADLDSVLKCELLSLKLMGSRSDVVCEGKVDVAVLPRGARN